MRRFRFRLGTLVILIIVLGVGFAALRESNDLWDSGLLTLTLTVLLISILLAVHRTERRRAFWLGFALFGAAYLVMALVPSLESKLITTKLLAYIDSKVPRSITAAAALYDILVVNNSQPNALYLNKGNGVFQDVTTDVGSTPAGNQGTVNGRLFFNNSAGLRLWGSGGSTENFVRIGHWLLALIFAFMGGRLSGYLYAKNRQPVQGSERPIGPISSGSGS